MNVIFLLAGVLVILNGCRCEEVCFVWHPAMLLSAEFQKCFKTLTATYKMVLS